MDQIVHVGRASQPTWSCVSLPVAKPVPGPFFVTPEITYLRDSPGYEGKVLTPLYKGDKVARLDAGEGGADGAGMGPKGIARP